MQHLSYEGPESFQLKEFLKWLLNIPLGLGCRAHVHGAQPKNHDTRPTTYNCRNPQRTICRPECPYLQRTTMEK